MSLREALHLDVDCTYGRPCVWCAQCNEAPATRKVPEEPGLCCAGQLVCQACYVLLVEGTP